MTRQELIDVLDMVQKALETNKRFVTPAVLRQIAQLIIDYGFDPRLRFILVKTFNIKEELIDEIIDVIITIIEYEKLLVEKGLTEKLIAGIKNLKGRPAILTLLAALI